MNAKNLYSLVFFLCLLVGSYTVSCKKHFTELNTDTKALPVASITPEGLFSYAQKSLSDFMASVSVNVNVFRFFAQYWGSAQYQSEPSYNVTQRNIANNIFDLLYRGVLSNLHEAKKISLQRAPENIADRAMMSILEVYAFALAVELWGDVPYSQAFNIDNISPKYDDGKTVYLNLADRLDNALADLKKGGSGLRQADLVYGGDTSKWRKFGNSLKIRMGLMLGKVDKTKAKSMIDAAKGLAFERQEDSYIFRYLSTTPNTNSYYANQVLSGRFDFLGTTTFIDTLKKLGDPRLPYFFQPAPNKAGSNGTQKNNDVDTGKYVGQTYGKGASRSATSRPGTKVEKPDADGILMDYAEVQLYLAEACSRGLLTNGSSQCTYLVNGVVASVKYWKGDSTGTANTLKKLGITLPANSNCAMNCCMNNGSNAMANNQFCKVIALQQWIAFYNRGYEGWNVWRRYGTFPDSLFTRINPNKTVDEQIPQRFLYPINEETLNGVNLNAAIARVGPNKLTTKLFFFK